MRLTAWDRDGKRWAVWEDVECWLLRSDTLTFRTRDGRGHLIQLPKEVLGLSDDTPPRVTSEIPRYERVGGRR